jgi:2,3-bisphosphoglycerate-independent phosphoglycerate mutase
VCTRLTDRLRGIRLSGVELFVEPVKEHRFVLVLRGAGLGGQLTETDPQTVGKAPLPVRALDAPSERTADLVNTFVGEAQRRLVDAVPANMVLLRGFDRLPDLPRFPQVYQLRAAAIAAYPMYRGLARVVGMEVLKTGTTFADEMATLRQHWETHDFFFLHYKDTDKAGEDGDFSAKVQALERLDRFVPEIEALSPDVFAVTGDHASPAVLAGHGWQPVPVILWSRYCGADRVQSFDERACAAGSLGVFPAQHLMPQVLANALRLTKFGA